MEVLKEEFGQLQRMSRELEREVLLFNYAVFGTNSWSDQARRGLTFGPEIRAEMVQSVQGLYDKVEVLGHREGDRSCILARDQFIQHQAGSGESLECLLLHEGNDDGERQEHRIVKLNRNCTNTVNMTEANGINQQYAVYEFADPVKGGIHYEVEDQKPYSLFVSKI